MEEKEEPEVQMRVVVFYLGLAEGLGRVGVEQVNQRQDNSSQADYGGQRMPATAEQNGGMNNERIQGGSQIGGDSGQIARATDDGQLAARAEGPADSGQRDAGLGSDRQAGGLGEGTGSTAVRNGERGSQRAAEQARLRNQIRSLEAERTSAKQIGIQGGTKNESLRVVPEELYTSEMREIANEVAELGQKVTFVAGPMEVRGRTGKTGKANGIHQVNRDGSVQYFIRADSAKYTAGTIFKHESFHELVSGNQNLWLDMVEDLFKTHTEEEVYMMVDAYVEALDGIYGVYEEGMTEDKQAALRNKYLEEIFADQYAGMNRGGGKQAAARGVAGETTQRFAGDIENARQNWAGIDRRNGPGTRLSAEEKEDQRHILTKLREAIHDISDMDVVTTVSENAFARDPNKQLSDQVEEYFETLGNKVERNGFGEVLLKYRRGKVKAGVASDIAHGLGRAKASTFGAVPSVIKYGAQIDYQENWKGRGYDTYAFAAPVGIGDHRAFMTAVVIHDRGVNAFYLHEVIDEDGNYIIIPNKTEDETSPLHSRPTEAGGDESSSINSIRDNNPDVKTEDQGIDWNGNREEPEARLSAADADDDSLGVDWIGSREKNADARTAASTETENPSSVTDKSVTPSPEGEDSGTRDSEETGSYEAMAREKKVEQAEKASIEGLKSRIDSAEKRLGAYQILQQEGMMTDEILAQMRDVQESLEIYRNALDDKKAKRKAAKEAEKNNKELRTQRKQARAA